VIGVRREHLLSYAESCLGERERRRSCRRARTASSASSASLRHADRSQPASRDPTRAPSKIAFGITLINFPTGASPALGYSSSRRSSSLVSTSVPSALPGRSSRLSSSESTPEFAATPTGSLFCIVITLSSNLASFVTFSLFSPRGLVPSPRFATASASLTSREFPARGSEHRWEIVMGRFRAGLP